MTYFLAILLKVPQNSPELTLEQNLHDDALQQPTVTYQKNPDKCRLNPILHTGLSSSATTLQED